MMTNEELRKKLNEFHYLRVTEKFYDKFIDMCSEHKIDLDLKQIDDYLSHNKNKNVYFKIAITTIEDDDTNEKKDLYLLGLIKFNKTLEYVDDDKVYILNNIFCFDEEEEVVNVFNIISVLKDEQKEIKNDLMQSFS